MKPFSTPPTQVSSISRSLKDRPRDNCIPGHSSDGTTPSCRHSATTEHPRPHYQETAAGNPPPNLPHSHIIGLPILRLTEYATPRMLRLGRDDQGPPNVLEPSLLRRHCERVSGCGRTLCGFAIVCLLLLPDLSFGPSTSSSWRLSGPCHAGGSPVEIVGDQRYSNDRDSQILGDPSPQPRLFEDSM